MSLFLIGFISQILFSIFRTINVQYVAKDDLSGSVTTGTIVAFFWVFTTKIGIDAYNNSLLGMAGYMIGAASVIVVAMRHRQIIKWFNKLLLSRWPVRTPTYQYRLNVYWHHEVTFGEDVFTFSNKFYTKESAIQEAINQFIKLK